MSAHSHAKLGPRDLLALLAVNLAWGLNMTAVKLSVLAVPPFTAAGLRLAVVLVICLPFLRIVPGRMPLLLTFGVLNGALFLGLVNLSLTVSDNVSALSIAGQLSVPFSLILGVVVLKERIAFFRLAGIVLAFGGVVMLVFDPAIAREIPGLLLTTFSTLVFAIGSLLQRRLAGVPVLTIYAWLGLIGGTLLLALGAWVEPGAIGRLPDLPLRDFGWIVFSALASTVVGQGCIAWLLQRHSITTVMPLTLGTPLVAVSTSSLVFGTVLTPVMILGGVVTLAGVAIITMRGSKVARGLPA